MKTLEKFTWPDGKRAAVSLTFDDSRPSQLDRGLPILHRHDVKATFYVVLPLVEPRVEEWKQVAAQGHEIGNHTVTHPCSGNFAFSRSNALEDYTLARMEQELTGANEALQKMLGVTPRTFAYPCGQKFVGRGEDLKSYVPLVGKHFVVGRGFKDECATAPGFCDLAQVGGMDYDGITEARAIAMIEKARDEGGWSLTVGHEVGDVGQQLVVAEVLDKICRYCKHPANGIWIDRVDRIGEYIRRARAG